MKKKTTMLACVLCCTLSNIFAQLKIDVPHLISLYNQGNYKDVFDEAYALRNNKEYGKMAVLDYFMAKALCGEKNYKAASNGFQFILTEYPLSKNQKVFILDEFSNCQKAEVATASGKQFLLADFKMVNAPSMPVAKVSGKLGYILNCKTDTEAYKFMPDFNREELQKRLFPVNEKQKAVAYYKHYLGERYNVNTSGRYIFITQQPYNLSSLQVSSIAAKMEKAYDFLHSFYTVRPPDKLIAVYLMRDKETLRATAKKIHGLVLPLSNIGYSSLDDLSILGNSDADNIGTIYHELFHMMIRTDIGDIPAWLDEGIACLYETSTWMADSLKGNIENWRTNVLRENLNTRNQIPQLRTIINDNWDGFILNEKASPCDVAINYAVAKHFAIYMQEHGLLKNMIAVFKTRKNVFTDTLSINESSLALVEKAVGNNIDSLQHSFDEWMNTTYQLRVTFSSEVFKSQFEISYETLDAYKYSSVTSLVNSEKYKVLEKDYASINEQLQNLRSVEASNAMIQSSPNRTISEELKKRMNKFIADVAAFTKEHPLD